jgi:hypothetical protein
MVVELPLGIKHECKGFRPLIFSNNHDNAQVLVAPPQS